MKCRKCGAELTEGSKFCEQCGESTVNSAANNFEHSEAESEITKPESEGPKNKKQYIVAAIAMASVILIGLCGMLIVSHQKAASYVQKIEEAQKYVANEEYETAIKTFDEAISIRPKKAEAYVEKADTQIKMGNPEEAFSTLSNARKVVKNKDEEIIAKRIDEVKRDNPTIALDKKIKNAYLEMLEDNEPNIRAYENNDIGIYDVKGSTALYDINEDGIPELFFFSDISEDRSNQFGLSIFTYNNDEEKIKEIDYAKEPMIENQFQYSNGIFTPIMAGGSEMGFIVFKEKNMKGVSFYSIGTGEESEMETSRLIMNDNFGVTETDSFHRFVSSEFNEETGEPTGKLRNHYIKNNKDISKETYDKDHDEIFDNLETVLFIEHSEEPAYDGAIWEKAYAKDPVCRSYDEMVTLLKDEKAPKDAKATNEQKIYDPTIKMIADAVNTGNADNDNLPFDLKEAIYFSDHGKPSVFYALKDLDQNGVQELIVGTAYESDPSPVGIYTVKDNEAYLLSELSFFYSILSDGTIHSLQGNGIQEGHPNGFFFKLKGTELEEVQDPGNMEDMEFNWVSIV